MRNRRARDLTALDAQLRSALTAEPTQDELTGEHAALATYRAVSWNRARSWRRPAVFATKLGVATVAGVLGLSGVATAAYTGSLPNTLQDIAHKTIKAPKAHPPTQAVGPDATGEAAYGLCQAFAKDKADQAAGERPAQAEKAQEQAHGKSQGKGNGLANKDGATGDRGQSKQKSVAYRNLVRAAGGEDKVETYCASVPKPSGAAEPESSGKPTAKPSHAATGKPAAKPTQAASPSAGSPSPHPTGSSSELPTP
jgi:hypothetical protein